MSKPGKDSREVVEFMTLFARLKLYSDDAPEDLSELAASDSSVKKLCTQLSSAAHFLQKNERKGRVLFAAPVDPAFLAAWRDYEERYEAVMSRFWLADLLPELGGNEPSGAPKADLQWDNADDEAAEQASGIAEAIEFAQFNADQEDRWIDQPDFIERIQDGTAVWDRLKKDTGFSLRGVFRRRALVPFVLVPRQVAAKHGSTEKLSMLKNLQEAHDAFVFGATYAALALMRSIMEAVLRDHYRADGKDLSERIRNARHRLPPGANEEALHRLRKLANAILHLDREKDEGLLNMDEVRLEKEVVFLLFVLRALIGGRSENCRPCNSDAEAQNYRRKMTVRLVDAGWGTELTAALRADRSEFRVVCPFIKAGALDRLLSLNPGSVQVITRFNLVDFAEGVSDVAALRMLLDAGAQVRGIRRLHAKLYLFASRAIITSANLTESALDSNHEFGLVTEDAPIIATCRVYFDDLWQRGGSNLSRDQVDTWEEIVTRHRALGGRPSSQTGLGDFGADAGVAGPPPVRMRTVVADARQAFVKFLGEGENRVSLAFTTIEEIERAGCHWAVAYPASKRPSGVQDEAIIFIARLTREPNDIRIFGQAIGMRHQPGRDDATSADIALRSWKEKWSRYIRVHHAEFVAGTMANGVSLNELMDTLGADSFAPTQRNAARGHGNTNPRRAYLQQAAVELSAEGLSWLGEQLQAAFDTHGKVPQDALDQQDWPTLPNRAQEDGG